MRRERAFLKEASNRQFDPKRNIRPGKIASQVDAERPFVGALPQRFNNSWVDLTI